MSYLVLARKYRPQTFEDVIGQQHVTSTLINAVTKNRLAQAYLFAGSRGTGKTTTARILAKCLNCDAGLNPQPCGKCFSCKEITDGYCLDVIEIDGASNRGIDEIRDLREKVKFAPAKGRYKVYIIDEVHMLTSEAFNALLKTLEEPPAHVIFMFATTEPHKIPATILSRCQRFDFKRVCVKEIVQALKGIAQKEEIKIEEEGLRLIARSAEGGLRDAESILDQAISYSTNSKITLEDIREVLGLVNQEKIIGLIDTISQKDASTAIKILTDLIDGGVDVQQFCRQLISCFRDVLLVKIGSQTENLLELPQDGIDLLQSQAEKFNPEEIMSIIDYLQEVNEKLKQAPWQAKLILEIAIIKMVEIKAGVSLKRLLERIIELEGKLKKPAETKKITGTIPLVPVAQEWPEAPTAQEWPEEIAPVAKTPVAQEWPEAPTAQEWPEEIAPVTKTPVAQNSFEDLWALLRQRLKAKKPSLESCLSTARVIEISEDKIVLGFASSFNKSMIEKKDNKELMEELIKEIFQKRMKIKTTGGGPSTINGEINGEEKEGAIALSMPEANFSSLERGIDTVLSIFTGSEVVK